MVSFDILGCSNRGGRDIEKSFYRIPTVLNVMGTATLTFINVYFPYSSFENEDIFREKLGNLKSFCDSIDNPNICLLGDFTAGKSNKNGLIFSDFCDENNLILSDKEFLPENSFTYISDAHSACTSIDHCIMFFICSQLY